MTNLKQQQILDRITKAYIRNSHGLDLVDEIKFQLKCTQTEAVRHARKVEKMVQRVLERQEKAKAGVYRYAGVE
jgi:uncharacterized coiled-coil protein SlyX